VTANTCAEFSQIRKGEGYCSLFKISFAAERPANLAGNSHRPGGTTEA
jgi:hypothetical protein